MYLTLMADFCLPTPMEKKTGPSLFLKNDIINATGRLLIKQMGIMCIIALLFSKLLWLP